MPPPLASLSLYLSLSLFLPLTVSSDELICGHNGGGCIVGRGLIYQGGEDRRETRSLGLKRDGLPNHRVTDRWIGM